jgi:hypothetical protein
MRVLVAALTALLAFTSAPARALADDKSATAEQNKEAATRAKALKPFAGKLILSPDVQPRESTELPTYLKFNLSKDGQYELIKGPPWPCHITYVFATPAKAKEVTLVISDKADKKLTPLVSVGFALSADRKLLIAQATPTIEAGFAAHKTYLVRLMLGKKVLAKAEVLLRD